MLHASVVLVLDLSKEQELWYTYETLYDAIAKRVKHCINEAAKQNPNIKDKLKESIVQRIGKANKNDVEPLRIPLLIVGSKYDEFQKLEPEAKKTIIKTLRFLAFYHGATLLSYSEKQESVYLKSAIHHLLFDTNLPEKQPQIDYQKPLYIKSGSDTLEQVGPPPIPEYELGDLKEQTPLAVWRAAYCKRFPQEVEKRDPSLMQDYGRDPQYADASIDAMREQKIAVRITTHASVVLVLDLSKEQELWYTYETLYDAIAKRVKHCINEAAKQNPNIKDKLKESIVQRIGKANKNDVEPLRIPLLIVGSKYDEFQKLEPEAKKTIIKTLRFLAFYHGATLLSYSEKQESVYLKSAIHHLLFDTNLPEKQPQIDYQKPLYIKSGSDTLEQVGPPPIPEYELGDLKEQTPLAVWRAAYCKRFPQEVEKRDPSLMQDYGRDPQYADASIDAMREQKIAELQRYLTMKTRSRS
ncbi:unnamed protein product [Adineta steineri]|uniref:Cytoplasmic dynein 2 light intermediate chain 1 n=1 Tax=Adineta steineri TaxID=433720 RepID=A0A814WCB8_9BILA|nr:unnamed protein product [Adineta steineri]